MRRHQTVELYPDSAYDAHLCLKPPPLLWLVVLYLSREITLPLAMGVAQMAGVNNDALVALRDLWTLDFTWIPSLLSALLLVLFFRRVPGASRIVRRLWAHGALLIAAAALIDFLLGAASLVHAGEFGDAMLLKGLAMAADLACLLYVLLSSRVKNTFAEFPAPN